MKLYAVIVSWFFEEDIEELCTKGEGHSLVGVYTDINEARVRFHEERDNSFIPWAGWPMPFIIQTGTIPETDIETNDTYWKARLDGYGYTKVSIETFEL